MITRATGSRSPLSHQKRTPGQEPELAWVAFSAHDEVGDDLRRRIDDPDLELVDGTHPVVYAGAGSHSGAYLPGDYIVTVALRRWRS